MARILEVISTPWPPEEGIANYALNLSKELMRRGNEVTVVTRGDAWLNHSFDDNGIAVMEARFLPLYPFHVSVHQRMVQKVLASNGKDFDLVHCHSPLTLPPKGDAPLVSTFHTPMASDLAHVELVDWRASLAKLMKPFSIRVEQRLLNQSDIISAVSPETRKELLRYGFEEEEIEVFWNGVDTELFHPPANPAHSKTILYVGRLAYRKGLSDLVESARIVLQQFPDWSFRVVGQGPLARSLVKARRNRKIPAEKFRLKGFLDRQALIAEYQKAELFVLPSTYEGLPTTLLEALASGLPVVATAVGGVKNVIKDGETGLLCLPGDPSDLASKVVEAIQDRQLRERLSRKGRAAVVKRFAWDRIAQDFLGLVGASFPEAVL